MGQGEQGQLQGTLEKVRKQHRNLMDLALDLTKGAIGMTFHTQQRTQDQMEEVKRTPTPPVRLSTISCTKDTGFKLDPVLHT